MLIQDLSKSYISGSTLRYPSIHFPPTPQSTTNARLINFNPERSPHNLDVNSYKTGNSELLELSASIVSRYQQSQHTD